MRLILFCTIALLSCSTKFTLEKGKDLTDSRDGNRYATIRAAKVRWMAENLRYVIPNDITCKPFKGQAENTAKYGMLYSRSSALVACPAGWHVPSRLDWDHLLEQIPGKRKPGNGRTVAKQAIADVAQLNIKLAGFRTPDGRSVALDRMTVFWTASDTVWNNHPNAQLNGKKFTGYHFYPASPDSLHVEPTYSNSADYGYYCRCVKN